MSFYEHMLTVFLGFFAIMNPIANTAIFVALTAGQTRKKQVQVAFKSLLVAFVIIALFALAGKGIFHFFGISLPALRITGGILVFLIGYHMLHGESSALHQSDQNSADIAVSPLALPILAGPGTIATAMNFAAGGGGEVLTTIITFAALCVVTFVCFVFGRQIIKLIGDSGLSIVTRLMGLILAVIGVQMLLLGVKSAAIF